MRLCGSIYVTHIYDTYKTHIFQTYAIGYSGGHPGTSPRSSSLVQQPGSTRVLCCMSPSMLPLPFLPVPLQLPLSNKAERPKKSLQKIWGPLTAYCDCQLTWFCLKLSYRSMTMCQRIRLTLSFLILLKVIVWYFTLVHFFAVLPSVGWEDQYRSHVCTLNIRLRTNKNLV